MPHVQFRDVEFTYDGAPEPALRAVAASFHSGWTGLVGGNGSGKTTLLHLAVGLLSPTRGKVHTRGPGIYCAQRTDDPPVEFRRFLESMDGPACALRGRLGVEPDWEQRWSVLSHGERKRAQLAEALWREPAVLAIDEPTNHLDREARRLLMGVLQEFAGVGLIVSHDRDLLDVLCSQCFFLEGGRGVMRPGGYSAGEAQRDQERAHAEEEFAHATRERKRLEREEARRRHEAARAKSRLSKRKTGRKDSDAKEKIDRARLSGKDAKAGRSMRQMESRVDRARERESALEVERESALGIWVDGERSKRDVLWHRPAGRLPMGEGTRQIEHPELVIHPDDRIAVTGPNGSGKSTLVTQLVEEIEIEPERMIYVPQEISVENTHDLLSVVQAIPRSDLGQVMTVVRRLGSDPRRVLDSRLTSPGETRKLLLALGIARRPHLIVMDEPTNHLDLPSMECLETALQGCPCALVLVSHDERFLRGLVTRRWEFTVTEDGDSRVRIR